MRSYNDKLVDAYADTVRARASLAKLDNWSQE